MKFSSKERVIAALNHCKADRVPVDLGGTVTTIHLEAYKRLLDYIGLNERIYMMDIVAGTIVPSEYILQRFHIDTRYIYKSPPKMVEPNPLLEHVDAWGIRRRFTGYYYDLIPGGSPLSNIKTVEDVESYNWPCADDFGYDLEYMVNEAERLASTDYAIGFPYYIVGSFAHALLMRGYQQFLTDLIMRPEIAKEIINKITNIMVDIIHKYVRHIGKYLDFVFFGDDLGTQVAPMISPKIYRQFVKPSHSRIVEAFKSISHAKVIIHSDGAISTLLEDMIETGIDGINPVQVSAKGMDTKILKEKFGKKLIFWGAIDTQRILPFGKQDDVRREVRKRIKDLAQDGGYVLASVHNIQHGVPPENIIVMFDEAIKFGTKFCSLENVQEFVSGVNSDEI
ncbi:MAG: uroporphyrinogen decarboxylase family protein [Nitrososphaeria archaeon]